MYVAITVKRCGWYFLAKYLVNKVIDYFGKKINRKQYIIEKIPNLLQYLAIYLYVFGIYKFNQL